MATSVQQIIDKRANVWAQMTAIMDRARDGEGLNAEDRAAYDAAEKDLDELEADLGRAQRHEKHSADMSKVDRSGIPGSTPETREQEQELREEAGPVGTELYERSFALWMRSGMGSLDTEQRTALRAGWQTVDAAQTRAAGVGTSAAGGYTVPPLFRARLIERLKQITPVRDVATVITTETGATLPWPTVDDTGNIGAILAENTQVTEQDVTFGQAQIGAYVYTSKLIRVSYQLLNDTFFDLEGFLRRILATRIGRIQNQHFSTGTGTGQPQGFVTGGVVGALAPAGNTTAVPLDSLLDLTDTLDPAYAGGNLQWMFSQAVRRTIRKIKDNTGQYMWQPSLTAGGQDTLMGYGIKLNNDMPAPAANAKSIAFGDFAEGYLIRDVADFFLLRLEERFADFLQTGFVGFQRTDAVVQNSNSYTLFQHSAT